MPENRGGPYPNEPPPRRRDTVYTDERPPRYQERRYEDTRERDDRREGGRRAPPEDWERRIDEKRGISPPKSKEDKRFWYRAKSEAPEKDRFVCENCGNPSLQFFADGLGRCPGCGQRFRYSSRPVSPRSKQKHKQFVCSKCDGKNLQFFLDGSGICPHCKREFKWKK
ncbi:MAG: hypothetical protein JSW28_01760 [Thermoplasmata archaeon]|nr:MAG: hypothetical protein JSW28_01760 [Thermoplasmata archaeon]